jgi:hypothetical protein
MTPVSEAVERVRTESAKLRRQKERNPYAPIAWGADIIAANAALADSMDAILADHARLTEQVRAQMLAAAPALSASPAPALGDQVERVAAVIERILDVRPMIDAAPSEVRRIHASQIARAVIAAMQPVQND